MYRTLTANDLKKHLGLRADYHIDGFITYGTWSRQPYNVLKEQLKKFNKEVTFGDELPNFLASVLEFRIQEKTFWFVTSYGGTLLSEYVHLASQFGSRKNIAMGSCGGLFSEANTRDIIIPTLSYGNESTTRAYDRDNTAHKHTPDETLSDNFAEALKNKYKVWRGPTVTFQAMLGETWEDVKQWSEQGYYGVEMEAATVFAVSNHFKVPSAGILMIGDNLIKEESVVDINYEQAKDLRQQVIQDMFEVALKELL